MSSRMKFKAFESSWDSWDKLFTQASDFANTLGRENLVNISHSCDGHNKGVVTVWYWGESDPNDFKVNRTDLG